MVAHVQLVLLNFAPLDPARQVDRRQVQDGVLVRVDVHCPPTRFHANHAPNHDVPNLGSVVRLSRLHENDAVLQVHHARNRGVNRLLVLLAEEGRHI